MDDLLVLLDSGPAPAADTRNIDESVGGKSLVVNLGSSAAGDSDSEFNSGVSEGGSAPAAEILGTGLKLVSKFDRGLKSWECRRGLDIQFSKFC